MIHGTARPVLELRVMTTAVLPMFARVYVVGEKDRERVRPLEHRVASSSA
jgi:hypothetical protein